MVETKTEEDWKKRQKNKIHKIRERSKKKIYQIYALIAIGYFVAVGAAYMLGYSPYFMGMRILTYTVVVYISVFVGWQVGRQQKLSLFLGPEDTEDDGL